MLGNAPFYHGVLKNTIIAFGTLFNDISFIRGGKTIQVPIAYAPKEKWIVRIEQDPDFTKQVYTILPKMSYEVLGFSYDPTRKLNRTNKISKQINNTTVKVQYTPVPYNVNIAMYVLTKTQEDGLQIIEQILPFFSPEYTLRVKSNTQTEDVLDVPVILNDINVEDEYDGDFQERRFITYTLQFTLKINLFGPDQANGKPITHVHIDTTQPNSVYDLLGDLATRTVISETITE